MAHFSGLAIIPNITLFDLQGERGPQGDEGPQVKFHIVVQVTLIF